MQRSSFPWFWLVLAAIILLLPGTAGRLLLDVLGGVTLLILLLPLLAVGAGFLAWQAFRSRLMTCEACGTTSFGSTLCPACGASLTDQANSTERGWTSRDTEAPDPGQVTIDVEVVDVPSGDPGDGSQSV
ncbi:MAG: hypothetical protein VKO39_06455 [Cyanobacteriota bacterium]|nr:hypothetical protein [Cyanobacteriota bacterium]